MWIDEPNRRWGEIVDAVDLDLRDVSPYKDDYEEDDVDVEGAAEVDQEGQRQRLVHAATQALGIALAAQQPLDRLQAEVNRQLAAAAMYALTTVAAPDALGYVRNFVGREPQHTDIAARYLVSLADSEAEAVRQTLIHLIDDPGVYLSPWQSLWLFEVVRALPDVPQRGVEWVHAFITGTATDAVRARAALTLAEKRHIHIDALTELYAVGHRAARVDIVAAIATLEPAESRTVRAVSGDDWLNAQIVAFIRGA
jgi:hypothetical protein